MSNTEMNYTESGSNCTQFAHPCRASADTIHRQVKLIGDMALLRKLYDAVSEIVMILNKERQIVFSNKRLLEFLGHYDPHSLSGLRPGEALRCVHAFETPGGCGTTEFCKNCGTMQAILSSQKEKVDIKECRITQKDSGDALDFRVRASHLVIEDESFTILAIMEISHEKRRRALERIFFHDLMNTALGIQRLSELLKNVSIEKLGKFSDMIHSGATQLVEEINSQRNLMAAENNELSVYPAPINSLSLLKELMELYKQHEVTRERHIQIDPRAQDSSFSSDRAILSRVLGNMLKNALEASNPGETVTIGSEMIHGEILFWVHNAAFMPRNVQLQIFQRSFSTKGTSRGLGTYSMKLLTERYLNGRISFTTSETTGTTFTVCYPVAIGERKVKGKTQPYIDELS